MKEIVKKAARVTSAFLGFCSFLLLLGVSGGVDAGSTEPDTAYSVMFFLAGLMLASVIVFNACEVKGYEEDFEQ